MQTERTPAQQLLRACAGTAAVAGVWGAYKRRSKLMNQGEQAWMHDARIEAFNENTKSYATFESGLIKRLHAIQAENERLGAEIREQGKV